MSESMRGDSGSRGLLGRVPGWLVVALGVAAFVAALAVNLGQRRGASGPAAPRRAPEAVDPRDRLAGHEDFSDEFTREDWFDLFQRAFLLPVHNMTIHDCRKYARPCVEADKYLGLAARMLEQGWSLAEVNSAVETMRQGMPPPVRALGDDLPCEIRDGTVRLDLFIMSQCDAALRYMDILDEMLAEMGDALDWHPHYVVSYDDSGGFQSLRGAPELRENRRQLCILRTFGRQAWRGYMRCYAETDRDAEGCAAGLGLDGPDAAACLGSSELEEHLRRDADLSTMFGVRASPTAVFNCRRSITGTRPHMMLLPMICAMLGDAARGVPVCNPGEPAPVRLDLSGLDQGLGAGRETE